jgi:hypothetical protein
MYNGNQKQKKQLSTATTTIRQTAQVTHIKMLARTTMDNIRNLKAKRKTSHQQHTKLLNVGSVTKRVILKSTVDHGYVKINHSHGKIRK